MTTVDIGGSGQLARMLAILGPPLGDTAALGHAAMVNLIGTTPKLAWILAAPGAHLHLYGKFPQPGRKLGRATLRAARADDLEQRLPNFKRMIESGVCQ